jgi:hypothetical protein
LLVTTRLHRLPRLPIFPSISFVDSLYLESVNKRIPIPSMFLFLEGVLAVLAVLARSQTSTLLDRHVNR